MVSAAPGGAGVDTGILAAQLARYQSNTDFNCSQKRKMTVQPALGVLRV
jgi:hypothetical protein